MLQKLQYNPASHDVYCLVYPSLLASVYGEEALVWFDVLSFHYMFYDGPPQGLFLVIPLECYEDPAALGLQVGFYHMFQQIIDRVWVWTVVGLAHQMGNGDSYLMVIILSMAHTPLLTGLDLFC